MSKTCNGCGTGNQPVTVPYVVHESSMARAERLSRRLVAIIVLLIILLVGSNVGWLIYESQFETIETVEKTVIEATQDETGTNIVGGGDINYGSESKNN